MLVVTVGGKVRSTLFHEIVRWKRLTVGGESDDDSDSGVRNCPASNVNYLAQIKVGHIKQFNFIRTH